MDNSSGFRAHTRPLRAMGRRYFMAGLTLAAVFDLAGCSLLSGISDVPNSPDDGGAGEAGQRSTNGATGGRNSGGRNSGGSDNATSSGGKLTTGGRTSASNSGGRQSHTSGGVSNAGGHVDVTSEGGEGGEPAEGGQGGDSAGGGPVDLPPGVSIEEVRAWGLLTLDVPDCVATLVSTDVAIAPTSCLDLWDVGENRFRAPRRDGGQDVRKGRLISEFGSGEFSLIWLEAPQTGQDWPAISDPRTTLVTDGLGAALEQPVHCPLWRMNGSNEVSWYLAKLRLTDVDDQGKLLRLSAPTDPSLNGTSIFGSTCFVGTQMAGAGVCTNLDRPCGEVSTSESLYLSRFDTSQYYIRSSADENREVAQFKHLHYAVRPGSPPAQVWTRETASKTRVPGVARLTNRCVLRGAVENLSRSAEQHAFTLDPECRPRRGTALLPIFTDAFTRGEIQIDPSGVARLVGEGARWFSSLEGVVFLAGETESSILTLDGYWDSAPNGTRPPAFQVIDDIVFLEGAVRGASSAVFTLPPGARPSRTVELDITHTTNPRQLIVEPTGEAHIEPPASTTEIVSFDGKWFPVASANGWRPLALQSGANASATAEAEVRLHEGLLEFRGKVTLGENPTFPFSVGASLAPSDAVFVPTTVCGDSELVLISYPWDLTRFGYWNVNAIYEGCDITLDGVAFAL